MSERSFSEEVEAVPASLKEAVAASGADPGAVNAAVEALNETAVVSAVDEAAAIEGLKVAADTLRQSLKVENDRAKEALRKLRRLQGPVREYLLNDGITEDKITDDLIYSLVVRVLHDAAGIETEVPDDFEPDIDAALDHTHDVGNALANLLLAIESGDVAFIVRTGSKVKRTPKAILMEVYDSIGKLHCELCETCATTVAPGQSPPTAEELLASGKSPAQQQERPAVSSDIPTLVDKLLEIFRGPGSVINRKTVKVLKEGYSHKAQLTFAKWNGGPDDLIATIRAIYDLHNEAERDLAAHPGRQMIGRAKMDRVDEAIRALWLRDCPNDVITEITAVYEAELQTNARAAKNERFRSAFTMPQAARDAANAGDKHIRDILDAIRYTQAIPNSGPIGVVRVPRGMTKEQLAEACRRMGIDAPVFG